MLGAIEIEAGLDACDFDDDDAFELVGFDSSSDAGCDDWHGVDRALKSLARRQSGLDAELMVALREAERVKLWRHVGCASLMEYLERVFGYSPRVAQERMRTARKLAELPVLSRALAENELPFSAIRELSRIATTKTEANWRAVARGKCLREIEELVSGHKEGDEPTSPKNPELQTTRVTFEGITPATRALEREARRALAEECGEHLDDDAFLAALYRLALFQQRGHAMSRHGSVEAAQSSDGDVDVSTSGTTTTAPVARSRAPYQIVHYKCDECGRTKRLGGGVKMDLDAAEAARGECDADHVSLDQPSKVTRDIPQRTRLFVELRDAGRCRVPGCRSSRCLEIHHIIHLEDGGSHDPENLILLCGGHHKAHHRGVLWIAGTASTLQVRRVVEVTQCHESRVLPVPIPSSVFRSPSFDEVERRQQAIASLKQLGWKPKIAAQAVDEALEALGSDVPLDVLVMNAVPRCRD